MAEPKRTHQSAITNRTAVLPGADGRSGWVRRMRDVTRLHENDLGGADVISEAERSLIRRAATLTVELEALELRFATSDGATDPLALDLYMRGCNSLRRLLETTGIKRVPRDVTSLGQILGAHRG
jgi:hypothetical protein